MSELRDLYQELILDHGKRPRNFGDLEDADCRADGHNPLCGDKITVYEIRFSGSGCAISTASASLMSEALHGKTMEEFNRLFGDFRQLVTQGSDVEIGKLRAFEGVREFPMRVKCATLCWHTMRSALAGSGDDVTTE